MIPERARRRVLAEYGEAGAAWLARLPGLVGALADEWRLREVGSAFPGTRGGFVGPVIRADGVPLVLKVTPASPACVAHEASALTHWAGRGAVRLEAADPARGAILVERAIPGDPLADLCRRDDRGATAAAADVIARLRAVPAPADDALPDLRTWTSSLDATLASPTTTTSDRALTTEFVAACRDARAIAAELLAERGADTTLHGDLHHHNLLAASREPWLAADPKGVRGPIEAECAALLRNPRRFLLAHPKPVALVADRIGILAERLGDEPARVAGWGYVLAVVAACWAAEDGDGDPEIRRWCACAKAIRGVPRRRPG